MHDPISDKHRVRAAEDQPEPATPRRRFCKGLIFGRRHNLTIAWLEVASRPANPGQPGRMWV